MLLVACSSATESTSEGSGPPPFPGSTGTTAWRAAEDPPEGFGPGIAAYGSPYELLEALLDDAVKRDGGLPEGMRLVGGISEVGASSASAWIQVTGSDDDSLAGAEMRLMMRRSAAGWFAESLSWREHCRRGVDLVRDVCL